MINQALGGMMVAPWEVDQLPNEWLDVFQALALDFPRIQDGRRQVEARLSEWRNKQHG